MFGKSEVLRMRYYVEIDEQKIKEIYPEIDDSIEHIHMMLLYFRYHNKNLTNNQRNFLDECDFIFTNSYWQRLD